MRDTSGSPVPTSSFAPASTGPFSPERGSLYHPYDGSGDIVADNAAQRDELRDRFADWLAEQPCAV